MIDDSMMVDTWARPLVAGNCRECDAQYTFTRNHGDTNCEHIGFAYMDSGRWSVWYIEEEDAVQLDPTE